MPKKVTYTKNDLIEIIHDKISVPKDRIKTMVDVMLESMNDIFNKRKSNIRLEIRNFGVFEIKPTKAKLIARRGIRLKLIECKTDSKKSQATAISSLEAP